MTAKPQTVVVNLRYEKCDIRVDRSTALGNPFVIGRDGERLDVIRKHRDWIWWQPSLLLLLRPLHGKGVRLGCWCRPLRCHGETLARIIDTPPPHVRQLWAKKDRA